MTISDYPEVQSASETATLSQQMTGREFESYIKFTNEETPIENIEPVYCPNTPE